MESPSSQAVFIAVMNCSFVHFNSLRSRCAASFCSWVILNTAMIISGGICSPATSLRDCEGQFAVWQQDAEESSHVALRALHLKKRAMGSSAPWPVSS